MYITKTNSDAVNVAVIGGGAAGMMAAIKAAELGASVTIFEKTDRMGKKLRITGKGRCNVTNDSDRDEFFANIPRNPRFLYAAFSNFSSEDTKDFFEGAGVPLKTERGKRVFPVSDKAQDIVDAMKKRCSELGCRVVYERACEITAKEGRVTGVKKIGRAHV